VLQNKQKINKFGFCFHKFHESKGIPTSFTINWPDKKTIKELYAYVPPLKRKK
jgi:hypothetical protein